MSEAVALGEIFLTYLGLLDIEGSGRGRGHVLG